MLSSRFATPKDAEALTTIAVANHDIPVKDIRDSATHPTGKCLIVEEDGLPVLYIPFHCLMEISFLAFAPGTDAKSRYAAMEKALEALKNFAIEHGIACIQALTSAPQDYKVNSWARQNGFDLDERVSLKLKLPRSAFAEKQEKELVTT